MMQMFADERVAECHVPPSNLIGGEARRGRCFPPARPRSQTFGATNSLLQLAFLCVAIIFSGCGSESESIDDAPEKIAAPPAETLPEVGPIPESHGVAYVKAVDLDGNALPGMIPIATLKSNAFDEPLASGKPTGADGIGYVFLPKVPRVFVRAWDPKLGRFAGNFFEVHPEEGEATELMRITMPESTTAVAIVMDANGRPEPSMPVRIMLHHPTEGPWWPAETVTTRDGIALFEHLPPGEYRLEIFAPVGRKAELAHAVLPPGVNANLGKITLP